VVRTHERTEGLAVPIPGAVERPGEPAQREAFRQILAARLHEFIVQGQHRLGHPVLIER
jgi:hypothetical protein